ncbi:MAG: lysophospholipid acyltransferase family protein [Chthoniobacteraceae bacterium]|nr:lysophospholipid acyltransferase family protein [Chthoniobacteraceae bacterium]
MNPLYQLGHSLFKFVGSTFFSFRVVHPEWMIDEGPAILAMNHQSFLDPPMAGITCERELYTLARDTLFKAPLMGKILPKINVLPVDPKGGDSAALKTTVRILRQGYATLIFPEGTRSPDGRLQRAQPGVGLIIAKTLAPVVPMRIFGSYEALPRNGKCFQASPITVVLGKPLYFTKADLTGGREVYQNLADRVMDAIAAIEYVD